jgi:hypothetical protein
MTISCLYKTLSCAVVFGLLAACAGMPPEQESRDEYEHEQKAYAQSLQDDGRLAEARVVWMTVLTLDASDAQAIEAVAELDKAIAIRVANAWRAGESAYRRGNSRDGNNWMLKVLAAQPGHEAALARLGNAQTVAAQAQQRSKSGGENRKLLEQQRAVPGGINEQIIDLYNRKAYRQVVEAVSQMSGSVGAEISGILCDSHVALADQAEQAGDLKLTLQHLHAAMAANPQKQNALSSRSTTLRGQLSDKLYKKGLTLINDDLAAAIAALEEAVFYNPYNSGAKQKLRQAQKLDENLRRIRGSGGVPTS